MKNAVKALILVSAVLFLACTRVTQNTESFSIGLIGDYPYSEAQEIEAQNLIADLNAHDELSFVIHDGDFKGGDIPCTDQLFNDRVAEFNQSRHPLFYVFGDNEWVDCHRAAAGGYNPFERLAVLRNLFANPNHANSFGQTQWALERQGSNFPENILWSKNNVLFVGLHIVGSNNGLVTAKPYLQQAKDEYRQRNQANLKFLQHAFDTATRRNSPGIMVIIQANPWDFIPAQGLTGFEDFLVQLEQLTRQFGKPVVLVHGDSHYFRIDKPLPSALPSEVIGTEFPFIRPWDSSKQRLENFTRVETFGNPNTHWVKATIDVNNPNVFSFEPMIVEKNRFVPTAKKVGYTLRML